MCSWETLIRTLNVYEVLYQLFPEVSLNMFICINLSWTKLLKQWTHALSALISSVSIAMVQIHAAEWRVNNDLWTHVVRDSQLHAAIYSFFIECPLVCVHLAYKYLLRMLHIRKGHYIDGNSAHRLSYIFISLTPAKCGGSFESVISIIHNTDWIIDHFQLFSGACYSTFIVKYSWWNGIFPFDNIS